ncbi:arginine--tRNA ligase [Nitrospina watsonii]|uniref:Arginine--tRNA ligase n=1 Tax=Nitrospina watsonii TaxID=1323948 RepID=A0ABM9HEN9_9BACT|nr:arginine--tRNA ligase [Nitrospina watsonii]CAI2718518.1 Arginine--tRNA ligase [Nitrospina watsonii]
MKDIVKHMVVQALNRVKEQGGLSLEALPDVVVEEPKDEALGDFASTVAMQLAKSEKKNPREIAEKICTEIESEGGQAESATVAGPGFINIKMTQDFFRQQLREAAGLGKDFGRCHVGEGKRVLVEFVSANPTGPLHVGHGRGAAVGHALSCILKMAGFDVSSEYYINDVGNQMNTLGRSTWLRYKELLGETVQFPEEGYQGDYIQGIAKEIIDRDGRSHLEKNEEDALNFFRLYATASILEGIKEDLKAFRVEYDHWFSEQILHEDQSVDQSLEWLRDKGYIYDKDDATWLKTSDFDDDADRVLIKNDGEKTYFCADIAYHKNKIDRGFNMILDLWGADHHGYVPRMQSVLKMMGFDEDVFKVILVQFVALRRGGEKVSMSTRSGEFVTLADVVKEVGVDATRFFFLMRSSDSHLDFDLELAKKETPENPVYYIQYAHARICNLFRTAEEQGYRAEDWANADLGPLTENAEFALIKKILSFPECIEKSALSQEVHRIPFYLNDLVSIFHNYYAHHRIVTDNPELTRARLFLIHTLRNVIASGLALMGVTAPEKM